MFKIKIVGITTNISGKIKFEYHYNLVVAFAKIDIK